MKIAEEKSDPKNILPNRGFMRDADEYRDTICKKAP